MAVCIPGGAACNGQFELVSSIVSKASPVSMMEITLEVLQIVKRKDGGEINVT